MKDRVRAPARRVLLAGLALGLIVPPIAHMNRSDDLEVFVAFGEVARAGEVPYDADVEWRYGPTHWATWSPAFVPLAAIIAAVDRLGRAPTRLLLQLLNLGGLAAILFIVARWAKASRVEAAILGGLVVPYRLVLANFEGTQVNVLILGLVVGGVWLLESRRWPGALLFGLGAAIKATPLLLLPYLAWRGRWRDLGAAVVGVSVAGLVLPALIVGAGELGAWYAGWRDSVERSLLLWLDPWTNQSFLSVTVRLLGPEASRAAWWGFAALLGSCAALAFGKPWRGVASRRTALEVAVVLVGATMLSPIAWKSHYVSMVPLALCLFAGLPSSRWSVPVLWAVGASLNLTGSDLIGSWAAALETRGLVLWAALLLLLAGLQELWRTRRDPPAEPRASAAEAT